jgi:hypothetical protein
MAIAFALAHVGVQHIPAASMCACMCVYVCVALCVYVCTKKKRVLGEQGIL